MDGVSAMKNGGTRGSVYASPRPSYIHLTHHQRCCFCLTLHAREAADAEEAGTSSTSHSSPPPLAPAAPPPAPAAATAASSPSAACRFIHSFIHSFMGGRRCGAV